MTVRPYRIQNKSKKEEVAVMFDNIAGKYDFLNHLLSLGIDKRWRRRAIDILRQEKHQYILDVATGTADFAIEAASLKPVKIDGIDISCKMLMEGEIKIKKRGLTGIITLRQADSEQLLFSDNTFDAITVGFGVRNFENLGLGLSEMFRVLKPGGISLVLEFSKPTAFPVKQAYHFYFNYVLPMIGRLVSKDAAAYAYLPESVKEFPSGEAFLEIYRKAGFTEVSIIPLTFGIASIYMGKKQPQ